MDQREQTHAFHENPPWIWRLTLGWSVAVPTLGPRPPQCRKRTPSDRKCSLHSLSLPTFQQKEETALRLAIVKSDLIKPHRGMQKIVFKILGLLCPRLWGWRSEEVETPNLKRKLREGRERGESGRWQPACSWELPWKSRPLPRTHPTWKWDLFPSACPTSSKQIEPREVLED